MKELSVRRVIQSQIEDEALQISIYLLNLKSTLLKSLKRYHDKLETTTVPLLENEKQ